ncbi:hypothetical protein GE061_019401 [Apolygus lucorum]|uniref:BPL/LPL catalytic domain-containing protein n=1 Tax=Apolygus lucorum TaxID=248454 RepID=A0A8S9X9P6_APOLU|nr:hypothetical protein GE061_019401 [Apolygus lucorum]
MPNVDKSAGNSLEILPKQCSSLKQKFEVNGVLSDQCMNYKSGHIVDFFWYQANKKAVSVFPKQILDVSGWILVLKRKTHLPIQFTDCTSQISKEDAIYVLVEANYLTCSFDYRGKTIELDKYGTPLAWHASDRLSLLIETDERKLSQLLLTFMQNEVALENGIHILRILTVEPLGSPYKIGNDHTVPETYAKLNERCSGPELRNSFLDRWRAHVSMLCTFCEAVSQVKENQQDISVRHPGSGVGAVKLMPSGTAIGVSPDVLDLSKESHNTSNDESLVSAESYQNPPSDDITRCSSGQSSHISTEMSTAQGSTRQVADSSTTSMSSIRSLPSTPRRTVCSTPVNSSTKTPNIIIFSDSPSASECVKAALELTLVKDRYVIHKLTFAEMLSTTWLDDAVMVVVHGNVPASFNPVVMNYLAKGSGSLLCLCSDFLGCILPMFHTAEVRPNELVHCSYKSWKHVPLMHHVFCYQPTPSDPKFSYDEQASLRAIPESVVVKDSNGKSHKLKIDVLGVEETWQTPSLLLVAFTDVASKVVFSQVHLETAPDQFEDTDNKREALRNSDKARLEILSDVLSSHLELKCAPKKNSSIGYSLGYFLGNHEAKQELIEKLKEDKKIENNVLTNGPVNMKFCGKGVTPPPPSESMLPILVHSCPESFSTVEYFENLKTESIGRLVIFSEVMSSCLTVIENLDLAHGIAVIPYYQTKGVGRSGNTWLSPKGCAMFTIQVHIPLKSYLGQHLPIMQFIATLAIVASICELPNLEELDVGIKWPNDVYVNKTSKIGGVAVKTTIFGDKAVVNMGCGINLNNKEPTVCLNDVISSLSKEKNVKIPRLSFEKYFSSVFNKMEQVINMFNEGRLDEFYQTYYRYWLHSDAEVRVTNEDKSTQLVKITGIDSFGFLTVENSKGATMTVQPDGNSFDMMAGLISPKLSQ